MSGVAVVNHLLSNDAGVTALVAEENVVTGVIPVGASLPAISVRQISGSERLPTGRPTSYMKTERIQVTAVTADYDSKKTILDAVFAALEFQGGAVIAGVAVDSIKPDGEGPDLDDPGMPRFERSRDFFVIWHFS